MTAEERLVRRFGESVRPWLAELPDRLDRLAADWGLTLGDPFPDGASAVTLRAERAGVQVVLKVSPDVEFAATQAGILRAFEPSGRVPALLAEADGALLMAWIDGTEGWPEPARFAGLLADLHAVAEPERAAWRDLRAGVAAFFPRFPPTGPVTADHLDAAWEIAQRLLDNPSRQVLLHGDLHRFNLLDTPTGLVVLDPQGTLGEPEFDAVDFVLDGPGIEARRDALVAASDLDPDRLDGWCRAMAPLVAVGKVRRGEPVAELIAYSAPTSR
ncbi:MAG TPA: aminoglycoside phosphotransferase family protein [Actinokineospora sp.]|nr:aminoglycoside phosphotransferase family protein [Actinokineospora sp.]